MLIGRDHSPFLEKTSKLDLKRVILLSILGGFVFNIGHIFQYEVNDPSSEFRFFTIYIYDKNAVTYLFLILYVTFGPVFSIVCFSLNYAAFFLLNTAVESILCKSCVVRRQRGEQEGREWATHPI
jgi:hypothetical protein